MIMHKTRLLFFCSTIFFSFFVCCFDTVSTFDTKKQTTTKKSDWLSHPRLSGSYRRPFTTKEPDQFRLTHALGTIASDMFWVNAGLFSWDTFKILVTTAPFYAAAR